jgi:hypothetical protein
MAEAGRREYDAAAAITLGAQAQSAHIFGTAHTITWLMQFLCCELLARANDHDNAAHQFAQMISGLVSAIGSASPDGDEAAVGLLAQFFATAAADPKLVPLLVRSDGDGKNLKAIADAATSLLASKPQQACALMQAILDTRRLTKGADHDDTLLAAYNLSAALIGLEDYAAAAALAQDTFERCRRRYRLGHVATLRAGALYALALFKSGRAREALGLQHQIYQASRATNGEDHQQTRTALGNLLDMQKSM